MIFTTHQCSDIGFNATNKIIVSIIVIKDVKTNVLSALENVLKLEGLFVVGIEFVLDSLSSSIECVLFHIEIPTKVDLDIWI